MIGSFVVLLYGLKKSAKIRQKSTYTSCQVGSSDVSNRTRQSAVQLGNNSYPKTPTVTDKFARTIKVYMLIAAMCFLFNFPILLQALIETFMSETNVSNIPKVVVVCFADTVCLINVSAKVFVLYSVNTNYRRALRGLFKGSQ